VPLAPEELLRECVLDSLEPLADGRYRWRYVPHVLAASAGDAAIPAPSPAQVPTLLVLGADSPMVTDAQLAWLRAALGDLLQTVTVPGRHSVLLDALPESGEAIRAFVARAAAPVTA
jgi:pimeloyl-ACP methyl ester carboxylesterase